MPCVYCFKAIACIKKLSAYANLYNIIKFTINVFYYKIFCYIKFEALFILIISLRVLLLYKYCNAKV